MNDSESTPNQLQQRLTTLHAHLSASSSVDEPSRTLLRDVLSDVERLLGSSTPVPAANASKLESLAVRFESEHPALSGSLREFVDLLGRAGI